LIELQPVRDRFGLRATASRLLAAPISEVFASRKPSVGTPTPAGAVAGWGLHPLESAAFARRTPLSDLDGDILFAGMAVTAMAYWCRSDDAHRVIGAYQGWA